MNPIQSDLSRRNFLVTSAGALAAATVASTAWGATAPSARLKVGLIGCGGRGTGAAGDNLAGSPDTEIWAVGDVFKDRVDSCLGELRGLSGGLAERVNVTPDRAFTGFDAYKQVLSSGIDLAILATAPGFRPIHFEAAIAAGKHVFFEKPVGVDPTGIRRVLAAGESAKKKGLAVVTGTQRRHENCYLEAMNRILTGNQIGKIITANCWWNQGPLWVKNHAPEWSDMEWQIRNWLYFTWLSGDHIVEQHVHNLDVCNWAMGGHPVRCVGLGGRQVRTAPEYGHIFDHFAVQYTYADGRVMNSQCRQIDGCASRVAEQIIGSEGVLHSSSGVAEIKGERPWKFERAKSNNPYVTEHTDLVNSIKEGKPLNEAERIAESTLTAIMGRMSCYTGQEVTWEQALNSKLDLLPPKMEFAALPVPPVAVPGKTPLV